jgi:hypothetical protein
MFPYSQKKKVVYMHGGFCTWGFSQGSCPQMVLSPEAHALRWSSLRRKHSYRNFHYKLI